MNAYRFSELFLAESSLTIEFGGIWHAPADAPHTGLQSGVCKTSEYWNHLPPSQVAQEKMVEFIKALKKALPEDVVKGKGVVLSTGLGCLALCNNSFVVIAPYFREGDAIAFTKGPQVFTPGRVVIVDDYPLRCFSEMGKLLGRADYWNRDENVVQRFANQIISFSEIKDFDAVDIPACLPAVEV
jgi:hypothetical protein